MQGAQDLGELEDPEIKELFLSLSLSLSHPHPQKSSFGLSLSPPPACGDDAQPPHPHLHMQGLLQSTHIKGLQKPAAQDQPCLSNQSGLTDEGKPQQKGETDLSEVQKKLCLDNSRYRKRPRRQTFKRSITDSDGYVWRKYIQDQMERRSYFKCANSNCGALKIEEPCNDNTSMLWVTCIGQHTCQHSENADHSSTPLFHESSRALSSLADSSASPVPIIMEEGESQKKLVEDSSEHSSPTSQDAADRVSELCPSNQMEVSNDGKEQQVKCGRNLKELGRSKNFAPMTFAIKTDKAVLKDGFMWRKQERNRIGSRMPRSYYKCAKSNCRFGKQVQRCDDDDSILIITYWGRHTCIPSENADTSGGEAVKAFPDLADSSTGRVPIFMEEGEFENKFVEDSSYYFHPTSSHQLDDFPSWNADPVFGELNQPVNYNEEGDVISLHDVLPASTTSSLYKLSAGTKVLLTLEITSLGESIFVGLLTIRFLQKLWSFISLMPKIWPNVLVSAWLKPK